MMQSSSLDGPDVNKSSRLRQNGLRSRKMVVGGAWVSEDRKKWVCILALPLTFVGTEARSPEANVRLPHGELRPGHR
jgi:hypothetical protein